MKATGSAWIRPFTWRAQTSTTSRARTPIDERPARRPWDLGDNLGSAGDEVRREAPLSAAAYGFYRFIIAVLSIATELERMGDYVGIGKIVLLHDGHPLLKPLVDTYSHSRDV